MISVGFEATRRALEDFGTTERFVILTLSDLNGLKK